MRMRLVLVVTVVVTFTMPRPSSAIADWIWELSGPRLVGPGAYCIVGLHSEAKLCDEVGWAVLWKKDQVRSRFWVRGMSSFLFPWDNNPSEGAIYAARFQGTFEGRWTRRDSLPFMVYSGAGYSYNRFFGNGFPDYSSPAWIVTPIGIQAQAGSNLLVRANLDVRWFDKTFNLADASNPLPGNERTIGWSVSFILNP